MICETRAGSNFTIALGVSPSYRRKREVGNTFRAR